MFSKVVFICCLALSVQARSASTSQNAIPTETARSEDTYSFLGDMRYVYKVYQECSSSDLSSCLKLKLISAMDRAERAYNEVPIVSGVAFVKDTGAPEEPAQSVDEIEANLPRALSEREDALNSIIADKIFKFFESHTLQVKFPTASELQRSLTEESRGKKKKLGGLLLIPLVLGGTLIPLALGALALLAGKALIVSKLALVLAGIIGLKKLLGGGGSSGHETAHEVHVGSPHTSGWGRSYEKEQAQNMAYNAYAPKQN